MASFGDAVSLLKQTGKEIGEDNCTSLSAAIAYYTLFSLPPLLVILVGVAGAVFGADVVQERLTGQVGGLVGESGAAEIQTMIENAGDFGGGSLVGKVLGLLALVFGATGAFAQLQQALNRAWEVKPDPSQSGVTNFLTKRVLSFGMVLTIAFLLMVSLAASALLSGLFTQIESALGPVGAVFAWIGELVLSLGIFTLLFAAIFKVLPDAEITWRDVWVGALVTALLFVVGKFLIGFYLGRSNPGEAFGAAGSVVVILVWLYYTSLILLAGAEFTQVWAKRYGSRIEPDDDAVRVIGEERVVDEGETRPPAGRKEGASADEHPDRDRSGVPHPYAEPREPEPRSGPNE
jgi:membrane protein